jgi:hypothetical protein
MKQVEETVLSVDKNTLEVTQCIRVRNIDETHEEIETTLYNIVEVMNLDLLDGMKIVHPDSFETYVYTQSGWVKEE